MKPFSLGAVLKYRQQLEDGARQQLYEAMEAAARLQEQLFQTENELAELYASQQQDREAGTTADRLILFEHRIGLVKGHLTQQQSALDKQQHQVEKKRQHLVKTSKDRKIMEKLREQQNAAYKKYLEKKETGLLDEIAVLSHDRKQS